MKDYFDRHAQAWVEAAYAGGRSVPRRRRARPARDRGRRAGAARRRRARRPRLRRRPALRPRGRARLARGRRRHRAGDDRGGARLTRGPRRRVDRRVATTSRGLADARVRRRDRDGADRVPARRRRALRARRRGCSGPAAASPSLPQPALQPAERRTTTPPRSSRASGRLLAELRDELARDRRPERPARARREPLAEAAGRARGAVAADRDGAAAGAARPPPCVQRGRRQHTPRDLVTAAEARARATPRCSRSTRTRSRPRSSRSRRARTTGSRSSWQRAARAIAARASLLRRRSSRSFERA